MICLSKLAMLVKMLKLMGGRTTCTSSLTWYFCVIMHFSFNLLWEFDYFSIMLFQITFLAFPQHAQLSPRDSWDVCLLSTKCATLLV